jgi:hypothetical protein
MVGRIVASLGLLLVASSPVAAATITIAGTAVNDQGQFTNVLGATTVDFNAVSTGTQTFSQGIATYTNVNVFSCATCTGTGDLLDDTTRGARAFGGGTYAIDFSTPISYFGLYWGSPDPDNMLTFYNESSVLFSFSGADLISGFGVTGGTAGAAYVNFFASPGDRPATRIVVSAGQFPFESDNHAFLPAPPTVPEPTSLVLIATGGVALLARRRNRRG